MTPARKTNFGQIDCCSFVQRDFQEMETFEKIVTNQENKALLRFGCESIQDISSIYGLVDIIICGYTISSIHK